MNTYHSHIHTHDQKQWLVDSRTSKYATGFLLEKVKYHRIEPLPVRITRLTVDILLFLKRIELLQARVADSFMLWPITRVCGYTKYGLTINYICFAMLNHGTSFYCIAYENKCVYNIGDNRTKNFSFLFPRSNAHIGIPS